MNQKFGKYAQEAKKIGEWVRYIANIFVWFSDSLGNFPSDPIPKQEKDSGKDKSKP